jgi:hypothetical protein
MANIFQIKRRNTNANAPTSLAAGELAYNEVGDTLYYGDTNGAIKKIAGSGSFATLDTQQTVAAQKTFTGSVTLSAAVATTQSRTDSSTSVANTAFVQDVASLLDGGLF